MAKRSVGSALVRIVGQTLGRVRRPKTVPAGQAPSPAEARGAAYPGDVRAYPGDVRAYPGDVRAYPGDFRGATELIYAPDPGNGDVADPGEIVWTWVPFEEDHSRGKDRPVLVIGRDGPWLLALPMTSKDHDRDAAQEARAGRHWADIGTGAWDNRARVSEVRVDRILRVDPAAVRRAGASLDEERFNQVAAAVRRPAP